MPVNELRALLTALHPGPVRNLRELRQVLDACWYGLVGVPAAEGRRSGRIETATWEPPILHIEIEEHEPIVPDGASRAKIEQWAVDVESETADLTGISWRTGTPRTAQTSGPGGEPSGRPVRPAHASRGETKDQLFGTPDHVA